MNSTIFVIPIAIAVMHVCLFEWVYPYRKFVQRKVRTMQRRIQLMESDRSHEN